MLDTADSSNRLNTYCHLYAAKVNMDTGSRLLAQEVQILSDLRSSSESWILLSFSLLASVLGSGMIFFDVIWNFFTGMNYSILASNTFLGASLSLSCGTLLMACFNAVLTKSVAFILQGRPEKTERFANLMIIPCLVGGVLTCLLLNWLVLKMASKSVLSCPHHLHPKPTDAESNIAADAANICESDDEQGNVNSLTTSSTGTGHPRTASSRHMGHIAAVVQAPGRAEMSRLLVVGIQTTVGIVIHRVPEGLLLFSATKTDKELGISLVLALSVHSFSEGFAIATPLYGALQNRFLVMAIAMLLGCSPPLLGGYIGYLLFSGQSDLSLQATYYFGLYMAATAGFMLVVCIQMISAALSYVSERKVMWGVVSGVVLTFAGRSI